MITLVTGGTGLIGSHLLLNLIEANKQVKALKRVHSDTSIVERVFSFHKKNGAELFAKIEWIEGDVLDVVSLENAMRGVTHVYHCAALVSFHKKDAPNMMKINVEGTANVVNLALEANIEKFCYVSSVAALGKPFKETNIDERTEWKKSPYNSNYSISKYLSEQEVWRASEEGLSVVMVNPTIVLGVGDWNKSSAALFKNGKKGIGFYTDGVNGFVDVRDVVNCMEKLMDSEISNERFITVSENKGYKEVFEIMARAYGNEPATRKASPLMLAIGWRLMAVRRFFGFKGGFTKENAQSVQMKSFYSNQKIKEALGVDFIPVEQSILEAIAFYK